MKDLVLAIIKKENTIWKHVYKNTWVSGSVTEVYPITLWNDYVSIQIDTKRSVFNKAIKRVVDEYPYIFANGMFCKNDESCPAEIRFYYTDTFKDVLMNEVEQKRKRKQRSFRRREENNMHPERNAQPSRDA